MRLNTSINSIGQIYIPKQERDRIGFEADSVDYIADASLIILLPPTLTTKDILKSLKAIQKNLKQELKLEKEKIESNPITSATT